MIKKMMAMACLGVLSINANAAPQETSQHKYDHVIYVTFDGTRWQDILMNHESMPLFWKKYANNAIIYGLPDNKRSISVASVPTSLPSYQSQMSGNVTTCADNDCGRIKITTLPEKLRRDYGFGKTDVAVFASWPVIANAIETKSGNIYSSTGNDNVVDPLTGKPDLMMVKYNMLQRQHHHDENIRLDQYTFNQAMHYFDKYKPKFMWVSLTNADEAGHENNVTAYKNAIASYDQYIDRIIATLKNDYLYDNTLIIITTDHGRGLNKMWTDHGPEMPETKATWAIVFNGELLPGYGTDKTAYSTLSIKPTIEKALQS